MTATLAYTSSREANAVRTMRQIAQAGALQDAARARREELTALRAAAYEEGQALDERGFGEFCFICSRATDHWGEHTPEQVAAWREGRFAR